MEVKTDLYKSVNRVIKALKKRIKREVDVEKKRKAQIIIDEFTDLKKKIC